MNIGRDSFDEREQPVELEPEPLPDGEVDSA